MNTTYTPPEAELLSAENSDEYAKISLFSISTRVGRVRYLSHLMLSYVLLIPALAIMAINMTLGLVVIGLAYIALLALTIIAGVQRLHDLDRSGWLWLLFIVPFINLALAIYLFFVPGSEGHNNYGAPPPPNKTWNIVVACLIPILIVIGIMSASFIPLLLPTA